MTALYYCDRCGREVTLDVYWNFMQPLRELHRYDLGSQALQLSESIPQRFHLCEPCYREIMLLMQTKPNAV